MDSFKNFLKTVAGPSAGVFTYTVLAAVDLEFYIIGNTISFEKDPFSFLLVLFFFAIIPFVLLTGSSLLYIGCNSNKNNWLSRKAKENAESFEKARKEAEEYNS